MRNIFFMIPVILLGYSTAFAGDTIRMGTEEPILHTTI